MAAAALDRLFHRCEIVNIRSNSYRLRRHIEVSKAIHPTSPQNVRGARTRDHGHRPGSLDRRQSGRSAPRGLPPSVHSQWPLTPGLMTG